MSRPVGPAILIALASALLVHSGGRFAVEAGRARGYSETRDLGWFDGLPMAEIVSALDARLDASAPVALGPSFRATAPEFRASLRLKLTEGLYPRELLPVAAHTLERVPAGESTPLPVIGGWSDGAALALAGREHPSPGTRGRIALGLDPWSIALALLALSGAGSMLLALHPQTRRLAWAVSAAWSLPAGALAIALLAHLATWLQLPLFGKAVLVVGLLAAPLLLGRGVARARMGAGLLHLGPFVALLAAVSVALARAASVPVTGWDGRVVWLLHAKQIFFSGYLPVTDAAFAASFQPTYPLLTPAVYALSSLWGPDFNERSAAVLGVALHGSALLALAWLATRQMGEARGFALAAFSFWAGMGHSVEAYADGLLATLLTVQWLALREERTTVLAWLAAAAAALAKREGLVFAALLALLCRQRFSRRMALGLTAALAPAALHGLWAHALQVPHDFERLHLAGGVGEAVDRTLLIVRKAGGSLLRAQPLLLGGIAYLAAARLSRGGRTPAGWAAFCAASAALAVLFAVFFLTPQPLRWHLETALPRLALIPSHLAVLALLASLPGAPVARVAGSLAPQPGPDQRVPGDAA
ncbi:MAG TPA: hypothetical protein VGN09_09845 [Vicinamibacteria bacterium]